MFLMGFKSFPTATCIGNVASFNVQNTSDVGSSRQDERD